MESIYSIQSPNLYTIYSNLLKFTRENLNQHSDIEQVRLLFSKSSKIIEIKDLGAGSNLFSTPQRKLSQIVRYSTTSQRFCLLYQYFCQLSPAENVIELGTQLGITTRYLSKVTKNKIYTFEGDPRLIEIFKNHLTEQNIEIIEGNIHATLPIQVADLPSIDFALIDATHTKQATLSYFENILPKVHQNSIVIIADIYWSSGMTEAWRILKNHQRVSLSLDFFHCGVLFFDPELPKINRILEY
jgi:predicted O-methyltransferase YrrM